MHLFADYIAPLTTWLKANPNWALFIAFFISFSESLAIIGSIIPGTITMTAIGMLAGSGVMRIDLTLCVATLGAIAGDSASYMLGFKFSDRLCHMWPFKRYPKWLNYGRTYFERHGGKSVLIGRFIGPLRPIIPVIAGMMGMSRSHFLIANSLSAIGWSMVYVLPGVLIGAASTQLSKEGASRLLVFIIVLLVLAWGFTHAMRWIFFHINHWLSTHLNSLLIWSKHHPKVSYFFKALTPQNDDDSSKTIITLMALIVCFLSSVILTILVLNENWVAIINNPIFFFLQSLRTPMIDRFFIIMSLTLNPLSQLGMVLTISISMVYLKNWRMLIYWLSLALSSMATALLISSYIHTSNFLPLLQATRAPLFPVIFLTTGTSLLSFLIFYIDAYPKTAITTALRVTFLTILTISGLTSLYLGDNWITSIIGAYLIGLTISLIHWLLYRRNIVIKPQVITLIILSCVIMLITTITESALHYKTLIWKHDLTPKQYVLTEKAWWHQQEPLLPMYSRNRIGKRAGLFNIQYAGSLRQFEQTLTARGWKKHSTSLISALIIRANGHHLSEKQPLMTPLFLNNKPTLIMTYRPTNQNGYYILRLWRSNYHLYHYREPIWIGSIVYSERKSNHRDDIFKQQQLFTYLLEALHDFKYTSISLDSKRLKTPSNNDAPHLLIIKGPK